MSAFGGVYRRIKGFVFDREDPIPISIEPDSDPFDRFQLSKIRFLCRRLEHAQSR